MTRDEKSKDAPDTDAKPSPELNITKGKIKKIKKKKKHPNKSSSSVSSSSVSDVGSESPLVIDESVNEQFYDAHESYHGLTAAAENTLLATPGLLAPTVTAATPTTAVKPATVKAPATAVPAAPAIGTALLVPRSDDAQDQKISVPATTTNEPSAVTPRKKPSTVTKPVTGPQQGRN